MKTPPRNERFDAFRLRKYSCPWGDTDPTSQGFFSGSQNSPRRRLILKTFYAEVEFTTIGEIEIMADSIEEARQLLLDMRLDTQDMDFVHDGWNPEIVSLEEGV